LTSPTKELSPKPASCTDRRLHSRLP
jgi:hypothetical protein